MVPSWGKARRKPNNIYVNQCARERVLLSIYLQYLQPICITYTRKLCYLHIFSRKKTVHHLKQNLHNFVNYFVNRISCQYEFTKHRPCKPNNSTRKLIGVNRENFVQQKHDAKLLWSDNNGKILRVYVAICFGDCSILTIRVLLVNRTSYSITVKSV